MFALDTKMPKKWNSVVFTIIQERNIPATNFILLTQSVHNRKKSKTVSTSFNASPSSMIELTFSELSLRILHLPLCMLKSTSERLLLHWLSSHVFLGVYGIDEIGHLQSQRSLFASGLSIVFHDSPQMLRSS